MLTKLRDSFGKWLTAIILGLISAGFVFWGVNFQFNSASYAAEVNGAEIPLDQFQRDVQQQESQYSRLYNIKLDKAIRSQIKRSVLEQLIQAKALKQQLAGLGYRVSDQRLAAAIRSVSVFQVGGTFNRDAYRNYLVNRGVTPAQFEARQRQQLALLDFKRGVASSSFTTPGELTRYIALNGEQRRFGYALFKADDFADQVKVADEQVKSYYKEHPKLYMTQEAASLDYIELKRADIADSIKLSDADLHKYYDEHRNQYSTPEERKADHILITAKKGETDAETRARAEAVLKRIQGGADFAKEAKKLSQDPGTAEQGGALGWISRGMLEGPFEDTLFGMKVGQVAGPVKTRFGYHIIKLDKIRGGKAKPFDEVKDKLAKQLRTERASDIFYNKSNELANKAFDAYDQLDSVAKDLGVSVKTLTRFPRSGDADVFKNSAPIVAVVFGSVPLQTGINSDLIKLSDNAVAVINIGQRFPPTRKPLAKVSDKIRATLVHQKGAELAAAAAAAFKSELPSQLTPTFLGAVPTTDQGDADDAEKDENASAAKQALSGAAKLATNGAGSWVSPAWFERSSAEVPAQLLASAFKMPPVGAKGSVQQVVSLPNNNHGVIVLLGVRPGTTDLMSADELDKLRKQRAQKVARAELGAYVTSVRKQADVNVPKSVLSDTP